jgi:hypothetical protein
LVLLTDYGGDWDRYLEAVYRFFREDFLGHRPTFGCQRVGLKAHPLVAGREATFWHFIQEGKVEAERTPDLRRCERIRWVMPIIQHAGEDCVKQWTTDNRGAVRVHLWLESAEYLVVLDDRSDYVLPWTAFCVTEPQRKKHYQKEYERWRDGRRRP